MGMRAWIYDRALLPLTRGWYREVLLRMEPGSRLLDVGIGTGGALADNADLVRRRNLYVTGVDIDADYVKQARRHMERRGLAERVHICLQSIYEYGVTGFDAVYFSASFMLMPDPAEALRHVTDLLAPGGRVFFTQTFHERESKFAEALKPMLRSLTTVDFGQVTYEEDFLEVLDEVGLHVVENEVLGERPNMSFRLVVASPMAA